MGWESFDAVRYDLGPLLQGQMRTAKHESAYNPLIIGLEACNVKLTWAGNLLISK